MITHTKTPMINLEQVNLEGTMKQKVEPTQKFYLRSYTVIGMKHTKRKSTLAYF